MNWDEVMNIVWPQLFQVDDENLSASGEFHQLLNLSRSCLQSTGLYIIFNTFNVYLWVGNQVDSYWLDMLFNLQEFNQLTNLEMSEEEIFFGESQEAKGWIQELYSIIQSLRISQLVYPEFKVLFEIDQKSEVILKDIMHEDKNKSIDFNTVMKRLKSDNPPLDMPY